MNVLVVDDSSTMLRIIKNILSSLNIANVTTALNGVEAYEHFSANKFDLLITDWNMPEMNGLELVVKVRKINQEIPIIMITTEGGKREVVTALKAGVNNYIVKPFTPIVLKEKLSAVLG